jgi:hypothetical protein
MYVDSQLLFSDEQAVTETAASTNYVDLGAVRDIGTGESLYVVTVCDVAMSDTGDNSTVAVSLEGDSTTTFSPDATEALYSFAAESAAGTVKIAKLNPGSLPLQYQYIQLKYTVANGDLTTGKFTSFITKDIQKWQPYADNITIS